MSYLPLSDVATEVRVANHQDSVENHNQGVQPGGEIVLEEEIVFEPVDDDDDTSQNSDSQTYDLVVENSFGKRKEEYDDHCHVGECVHHHHVVNKFLILWL